MDGCIKRGYIGFNTNNYDDPDNFYVKYPDKVLEFMTGKKWVVHKEPPEYKAKSTDYVIEFWSYNNGKTGHFARINKGYNSLQSSKSVREGKIVSYRICEVV